MDYKETTRPVANLGLLAVWRGACKMQEADQYEPDQYRDTNHCRSKLVMARRRCVISKRVVGALHGASCPIPSSGRGYRRNDRIEVTSQLPT